MPDVFFKCPDCHGHLVVDARGAGMKLPCPFCEGQVQIPHESDQEEIARRQARGKDPVILKANGNGHPPPLLEQDAVADNGNGAHAQTEPGQAKDDLAWLGGEGDGPTKQEELRRLSAMMNPEEAMMASGVVAKKGMVALRCPSCGQIVASRVSDLGAEAECGACGASFKTPSATKILANPGAKPTRGKLPERRTDVLRTADDLRRPRAAGDDPLEATSSVDLQFQELIRRELEKLTHTGPQPTLRREAPSPPPSARKRRTRPLAEHGEIAIRRDNAAANEGDLREEKRKTRFAPQSMPGAPLPELVALETMDLESEVAKQWGPAAVVNTRRLHWVASFVVMAGLAYAGWWGYHQWQDIQAKKAAATARIQEGPKEKGPSEAEKATPGIVALLKRFHEATTPAAKAQVVRYGQDLLPVIQAYYENPKHPLEPRNFSAPRVSAYEWQGRQFFLAEAEYTDSLDPLRAHMERKQDGQLMLDWKSLVGYGEQELFEFIQSGGNTPTELRMFVEDYDDLNSDPTKFSSYVLRGPKGGQILYGIASRETETGKRLASLFKKLKAEGKKRAELTVRLRFESDAKRKLQQVFIDSVVAETWVESRG